MTIPFHNVQIARDAEHGEDAYTRLCNALAAAGCEFVTETYSINDEQTRRDTRELFPTL